MTGFDARAHIDGILLKLSGDSDEDGAVFPSMADALAAKRAAQLAVMHLGGPVASGQSEPITDRGVSA